MVARDPDEVHRASTPLELLFDLCFVVAVSQAAAQLHHALAEGHPWPALFGYLGVFFAIWWAWMNFTWFGSAYDTDDVPYRLLTLVQIAGGLLIAAGVPDAFNGNDFRVVTAGYLIMRVALIAQWLRAAREDPPGRPTALRMALGVGLVQLGWLVRLALPPFWYTLSQLVLIALELGVPIWAESAGRPTTWHPDHIAERYGLFTLIVLGESVLAATTAFQAAGATSGLSAGLVELAIGGLLLVFGLWWSYFKSSAVEELRLSLRSAFIWGYGHFAVFASLAAIGAGLQVAADVAQHASELSPIGAALCLAVPVGIYLVVLALLHSRMDHDHPFRISAVLITVVLVLAAAGAAGVVGLPLSIIVMSVLVCGLVAVNLATTRAGRPA